jgi:predicted amino acid dehydrogenase
MNSYACGTDLFELFTFQLSISTPGQTTTAPYWVSTTYTGVSFASAVSGPTTMSMAAPQVVQDTSELGPHVGQITAAVVGASFGSVLIIILAMFLCLRKRSRPFWHSQIHGVSGARTAPGPDSLSSAWAKLCR